MMSDKPKLKIRKDRTTIILIAVIVVALLIIIATLIINVGPSKGNKARTVDNKSEPLTKAAVLDGTYSVDAITSYTFKEDGTGFMHTDFNDYKFTYKNTGDTLSIDFEEEKAKDVTYTYTLTADTLTLKTESQTFELKKAAEKAENK